jgi:hypothetical protein
VRDESKVLIELLSLEYKILQEKIDKIGAFSFTVKGWSVTLVVASIFAVGANRQVRAELLLLLLLFVALFFLLERKQSRLSFIFGKRLLELERLIRRVRTTDPDHKMDIRVGFVPGIAHYLHDASRGTAHYGKVRRSILQVLDSDQLFYLLQVVAVLVAYWLISGRSKAP